MANRELVAKKYYVDRKEVVVRRISLSEAFDNELGEIEPSPIKFHSLERKFLATVERVSFKR